MKFSEIEIGKKYLWKHLQNPTDKHFVKEVVTVIAKPGGGLVGLRSDDTYPGPQDLTEFNRLVRIRTADGREHLVQAAELAPLEKDDTE